MTIKEIARETGVSVQTVSRVINKRPDVSPETRASVEAAIAQHGFQPSAVARSLVRRRSQMIGVIAAGLKYFGVAQTLNGAAEEAEASGYSIILKELASFDVPDIVPVVEFFLAHRVEGIIFAPPQMGANIRHVMDQLPDQRSAGRVPQGGADRRVHDDRHRQRGRRAPCHRAPARPGRARGSRTSRGRSSGARPATAATAGWPHWTGAGIEPGPMTVASWSSEGGAEAAARLLDEDPGIDALFCASDQIALGALHVANARGIRIPEQLAVVGFDGLPETRQFTPSLTTVRQPLAELGKLAVHELVEAVDAETGAYTPRALQLPVELIIGDSAPLAPSPVGAAG